MTMNRTPIPLRLPETGEHARDRMIVPALFAAPDDAAQDAVIAALRCTCIP